MITKIFRSGNSRAVRIPATIPLEGTEVEIIDLGKDGILLKALPQPRDPWELFKEGIDELDGDWDERAQETDPKGLDW